MPNIDAQREAVRRYGKTEKGKATQKRYYENKKKRLKLAKQKKKDPWNGVWYGGK